MRVLVTGGAGFIGSHLCERLLADGHQVACLDNFYTGQRDNIAHLRAHERFHLIEHDVATPLGESAADALGHKLGFVPEWVFNLACPASPVHYQRDPVKTIETSVFGVMNMLALCRRHGARLLQASTSEVYGDPLVHPQTETYWGHVNPIGPRSCYDEGKRLAETLCFDHHRSRDADIRVVRIFNTYGPRMAMNDGRVVSNFVLQALRGEPLTLYGDGQQTRSFCYVAELVDGLVRMMAQREHIGPINLGNPAEFTIRQLAERVLALTGSDSELRHLPLPVDDPVRRQPDIERARTVLGWQPRVGLDDGLTATIAYFRARLASSTAS
ncbi:MAG: SDR family oxidoreductase [Haliangiales bacterium]